MAYNDDQNEYPVPGSSDSKRTSASLLPRYFRTNPNKKFLGSTVDQLTNPGVVEKINGFVGSRVAKAVTTKDSYISDINSNRENYQLEPFAIVQDNLGNVEFDADYVDILGQISAFGGSIKNQDKLFAQEFYAWNPHIDFDKFTNFREYYWLPNGPQEVPIRGQGREVVSTFTVETVVDDDNTAYVFSPDGVTRNKSIRLFRGQTYRFEVNVPGHPISFATSRQKKVEYSPDSTLVSTLYREGVVLTHKNVDDTLINPEDYLEDGFIENGVIEFTVPGDAPENLYYVSQNDIDNSGVFNVFDIEENSDINVGEEIVGKKTYTTIDGWNMSNGMKVYFQGNVTPATYAQGLYYVEGVGKSINLVPVSNLEVPAIFTQDTQVPFDANGFDRVPWSNARSYAGTKDYICINRRDTSRNAWARYNRWFHKSVIEKSANINNQAIELDQTARAKRPIIEFEPNLRLWNHGNAAKLNVDLVDTFTKDAFSTIEGSVGYNIDGVDLVEGMRILFTADTDSLVKDKIFQVKFITHTNTTQISLIETDDTDPILNQTVLVKDGVKNAGKMYWYDATGWQSAQDKTGLNQAPKFDLFDSSGNSLGDTTVYDSTDFAGNRLFTYRIGEGADDTELGFPLTYKNFVNIGDIVFDFSLLAEEYKYKVNSIFKTISSDIFFLQEYNNQVISYTNAWKKANIKSSQYVIQKYTGEEYTNRFPIDVYNNSAELTDLEIKVYVNNSYKPDYQMVSENKTTKIILPNDIGFTDIVVIKTKSSADKNNNGYYEIPHNFERNPSNKNITDFTLGEVNDHVEGLVSEVATFAGIQPGINNLRDLGPVAEYGRKFVQHSGPLNLSLYHLVNKSSNVVAAIRYALNEYTKFKRQFVQTATETSFNGTVKEYVDFIFNEINNAKTASTPFYSTDMAATGGSKKIEYEILDSRLTVYALSTVFDKLAISNKALYVYLNDQQLVFNRDYTFTGTGFVDISATLTDGDILTIHEYDNTEGSFIPPTPTKIGMFPAYVPELFVDSSYQTPQTVIRGHDGSITLAYNDYRDDLILEMEKRIFNNLKVDYNPDIFDINDIVGGADRNTKITSQEINNIIIKDFIDWTSVAKISDYTKNDFIVQGDSFTYNYTGSTNDRNEAVPGFWRGIYRQAFDTDRPHTHPWEMLGYGIQPTWWENVYGPAPYTSNNLILWTDLQNGVIREPGKTVLRNKKYIRHNLLNHIPVNENGQLVSPLESGYVSNFSYAPQSQNLFEFGDEAPTETAWRRSSGYPFSLMIAALVVRPAHTMGVGFDRSRTQRDIAGNLIYTSTNKRINTKDLIFPKIENAISAGFLNYISEYINADSLYPYTTYTNNLKLLDNKIGFKLAGFAEKNKLKLVLDSKTPLNKGNIFVPDENYNIVLRTSSPQEVATYSGVIIERTSSGYRISGYDKDTPYFIYSIPRENANDPFVNVGGISEAYITWTENKFLVAGKLVQYNDRYYRVNANHTTTTEFDLSLYTPLPRLPENGGRGAYFRKSFTNEISTLDYGTILNDEQQVVNFLLGYQKYLKDVGFKFEYFNKTTETVENWQLASKEFLFWITQNWATTSTLTLSPLANQIEFEKEFYVVDNVHSNLYGFAVLNANGTVVSKNRSSIYRDNSNKFSLTSDEEGIYLIKLPLIQKEHLVLIDNTTVFNDTIYVPETGYRQERLKVVGYRTDEWNGSLNIPGFIYDDAKVTEWTSYKDYKTAELVKYKEFYYAARFTHSGTQEFVNGNWSRLDSKPTSELRPNWDYRANQFADFYDLDTDNFDSEQQRLAQHLIGYQKREYLANIIQDDVSQYKFYQGFIQDKGTSNAITKLFDKLGSSNTDSVELYEEWAIRVGRYGATTSYDEVEFKLDESQFRIEPQLVEFVETVDSIRTDLVYQYPRKDVYLSPDDYAHTSLPLITNSTEYTKTAGYVKLDQVNFLTTTKNDMLVLDIDSVDIGSYIWVPKDAQSWNVYKHIVSPVTIESIEKTTLGFKANFSKPITFTEGDIVGFNNINNEVNGFWIVQNIGYTDIEIQLDNPITEDFIDLADSTVGIVSELSSRRVSTPADINNITKLYDLDDDDRVWVDNTGNGTFGVYDSSIIRSFKQSITAPEIDSRDFGSAVSVSDNNTTLAVGTPDKDNGKVYVYNRGSEASEFKLKQTLEPLSAHHDDGAFGTSVEITDNGQYLYVGAPTAANVKTRYRGIFTEGESYQAGDYVSQRGTIWRALVDVTAESSTINLLSQDWEISELIVTDTAGASLGYANQGVVYIYKKLIDQSFDLVDIILSPDPTTNEQFGIAIKSASPSDFQHNTVIRSLRDNGRVYFVNNKGQDDVTSYAYSRDKNYKGEWESIAKYIPNNIVYYEGELRQANTTVLAGNPFDSNQWDVLDTYVDYLGYVPYSSQTDDSTGGLLDDDSSDFLNALGIGTTYDISKNGEVLALGGIQNGGEYRIAIYRKTNGRFVFDENIDPATENEAFGTTLSLNNDGSKIAIGAQLSNINGIYNGAVYVYKLTNGTYVRDQILLAPNGEKTERFGTNVSFNSNKLAVTSRNGDTAAYVTFDNELTDFDNKATNIFDKIKDNGQVYIYETINTDLVYAEKLYSQVDISDSSNILSVLNRNHLYVISIGTVVNDKVGLIQDHRTDLNANAWNINSQGDSYVDIDKIKGVWLYDTNTNDLITYLDYIDPIAGRIAGPAEQELSYKTYYDPAVYNVGTRDTGISDLWGKQQVGKLWWNLDAIKWYNPYQGSIQYKSNTWNQIIPGFSVDVYEWVESDLLPSEWDQIADTTEGLASSISGTSLYSDDSYVRARVYDSVANVFAPKYYFWVKNKNTLPATYGRKISSFDVANLIADPAGQGYRHITLLDGKKFALHNIKNLVKDKDTILHVDYYVQDNAENRNIHSEYALVVEGLASSKPNNDIVDKWVDSLAGYDRNGKVLPDLNISVAQRYGILNNPNQTIFVNRQEALKQVVERVNGVLSQYTIVDDFDISPLFQTETPPSKFSNEWDTQIDSENLLRFVGTAKIKQATLTPVIVDGTITGATITQSGRGYVDSNYTTGKRHGPTVTVEGQGSGAEIKTYINNLGQVIEVEVVDGGKNYLDDTTLIVRPFSVLVTTDSEVGGLWAVYNWMSSTQEWFRNYIQSYDVNKYWRYVDWYSTGYNEVTSIDFVIDGSYALEALDDKLGNTIKIENIGSGGWILLEKIDNQVEVDYTINYKVVGRQNGTIEFSNTLYQNDAVGFDNIIYDISLYDSEPTDEIKIILYALRDNLFVDQLEVEWNKLFFSSIRYAMSEQVDLDWIFKSSFVVAKHNVGELTQKVTYQNDNLPNYQDYIEEVKPYSTKIREYISSYGRTEPTQTSVTDFDLPPRYDAERGQIISETIKFFNNGITGINDTTTTYPQKHWLDNVGFEITEFVVYTGGSGYTDTANVTVSGGGGPTLEGLAYIGGGSIQYIEVNTTGAKYFTTPTVTINGSLAEDGVDAVVYAQIGNSVIRSTHLLMKFDRVVGAYYFTTLDETETFIGNGGLTEFSLKWPLSTNSADISITVAGEPQLLSDFVSSNVIDTTKAFDRFRGKITFANAPANNAEIVINYKKSSSLLTAEDRINFFYKPTTNMPGKELSQLMDGVDYGGVQMDSIGFGENTGFDANGFGIEFDTFDTNYEDEIITLDGSTQIITLSNVLESGVTYNVYLNNVRIDDPAYDGASVTANPNAKMVSPQGDNITNTIFLDSDVIETKDGDIVIIRKSTSDGSFTPESTAFDVSLQGGNFEYTTATGIDSGDIVVDGDGFVTETTSKGPEEQVPGQVLDTVDIQVYNRSSDGQGVISVRNYITDGTTIEWEFDSFPQSNTTLIVKVDSDIINNNDLNVDYENKVISLNDSTALDAGKNLSILSIGTNGVDLLDSDNIVSTGDTFIYNLPITWKSGLSSFVTINGVLQNDTTDYGLTESDQNTAQLEFPIKITAGKIIGYTIYDGNVNQYSQMVIDNTFVADGENKVHRFTNDVALPVINKPLAHNILVKRGDGRFLNAGYRKKYTIDSNRAYDIDRWQFEDTTAVRNTDVILYINGSIVNVLDYYYDTANGRVQLLNNNVGLVGDTLEIFIIRDAEYYFINTTVEIQNGTAVNDPVVGQDVSFELADDSTTVIARVEKFSRSGSTLLIELQGYIRELFQLKSIDDTPEIVASWENDSTKAVIGDITLIETDTLSLTEAPADWETIDIYVFSNHDINEFERNTYDIVWNTNQAPAGTQFYIDKNLLSRGFIKLEKPALSANFVWVFKNGILLSPQNDYSLDASGTGVQLYNKVTSNDKVEVLQFTGLTSNPKFGYRIFKDMLNRFHFKRLNRDNEYELQQPLNYYDSNIQLVDSTGIQEPNKALGVPGVVWIDKERIEYFSVDGNLLRQLRRGTLGTGIKEQYSTATKVQGQGIEENIPYKDETSKTMFVGDASTKEFILDFVPTSINEIDVFLAGTRLRKDNIITFDKTVDQDSPEADVTINPEYTIQNIVAGDGSTITLLTLADYIDPPADGAFIEVVRRTGRIWNDTGKTLADSENQIARFITDKTISLPR